MFLVQIGQLVKRKEKVLPIYILSWMMHRHYMFKFGIQMPLGTPVKGGLSFNHFSCIIINGATQIGHNCTIFHGVTTALKWEEAMLAYPLLEIIVCWDQEVKF